MNFFSLFAAGIGVEFLRVFAGAQGGQRDGLGFAAAEHGRAVGARQNAHFAGNRADRVEVAAVQALALVHDQAADGFLLDVIEGVLEHEIGDFLRAEFFDELLADFVGDGGDGGFARQFPWVSNAGTIRSPASALASFRISSGTMLRVMSRFFLPARAASSFCASISGWQHRGRTSAPR